MKIAKITAMAGDGKPYSIGIEGIECFETAKTYTWGTNRLLKSNLGKIDSIFTNKSPKSQNFFVYCLPEKVDETRGLLTAHFLNILETFETQVSNLRESIGKATVIRYNTL